jgi:hypothetical protein
MSTYRIYLAGYDAKFYASVFKLVNIIMNFFLFNSLTQLYGFVNKMKRQKVFCAKNISFHIMREAAKLSLGYSNKNVPNFLNE